MPRTMQIQQMPRFRIIEAFGFLCEETCVILYWMGLWSLLQLTPLLQNIPFCIFCLVAGAGGLFIVKAVAPALILASMEESTTSLMRTMPFRTNPPTDVFIRAQAFRKS